MAYAWLSSSAVLPLHIACNRRSTSEAFDAMSARTSELHRELGCGRLKCRVKALSHLPRVSRHRFQEPRLPFDHSWHSPMACFGAPAARSWSLGCIARHTLHAAREIPHVRPPLRSLRRCSMSNSATGAASESDAAVLRTKFSKQAAATTGLIACVAGACYAGYELFSLLLDFPEPCRLAVQTAQSSADLTQLVTTYTHVLIVSPIVRRRRFFRRRRRCRRRPIVHANSFLRCTRMITCAATKRAHACDSVYAERGIDTC